MVESEASPEGGPKVDSSLVSFPKDVLEYAKLKNPDNPHQKLTEVKFWEKFWWDSAFNGDTAETVQERYEKGIAKLFDSPEYKEEFVTNAYEFLGEDLGDDLILAFSGQKTERLKQKEEIERLRREEEARKRQEAEEERLRKEAERQAAEEAAERAREAERLEQERIRAEAERIKKQEAAANKRAAEEQRQRQARASYQDVQDNIATEQWAWDKMKVLTFDKWSEVALMIPLDNSANTQLARLRLAMNIIDEYASAGANNDILRASLETVLPLVWNNLEDMEKFFGNDQITRSNMNKLKIAMYLLIPNDLRRKLPDDATLFSLTDADLKSRHFFNQADRKAVKSRYKKLATVAHPDIAAYKFSDPGIKPYLADFQKRLNISSDFLTAKGLKAS